MSFNEDISGAIRRLAPAVPSGAYNAQIPVLSFRYNNWRVIMNKNEIQVKDIEKAEDAKTVIEYLQNLLKTIPG